jgi:uncharacterized RDD family membrane protein YckC
VLPLEPFQLPIEYRRVGFGKRLVAVIIDGLIVSVLGIGCGFGLHALGIKSNIVDQDAAELVSVFYRMVGLSKVDSETMLEFSAQIGLGVFIIGFLYSTLEIFIGASVGKLSLGIVVAHPDGRRGDIRLWAKRWVLKNLNNNLNALGFIPAMSILNPISTVIGILFIIGCFFALGESRLALHDRIAQTAVFHKDDVQ